MTYVKPLMRDTAGDIRVVKVGDRIEDRDHRVTARTAFVMALDGSYATIQRRGSKRTTRIRYDNLRRFLWIAS